MKDFFTNKKNIAIIIAVAVVAVAVAVGATLRSDRNSEPQKSQEIISTATTEAAKKVNNIADNQKVNEKEVEKPTEVVTEQENKQESPENKTEPPTRSQDILNSENYILSKKMHDGTLTAEEQKLIDEKIKNDEKFYCCATLEDNYTEDCILVMIKRSAFSADKVFTVDDFPGVSLKSVEDHSGKNRDNPAFRPILTLYLTNPGKQEVLDAIAVLEKLDYVQTANVNGIHDMELD